MKFKLTIEDVSYTGDPDLDGLAMSNEDLEAVNAEGRDEGLLGDGILKVLGAHVAEDENQEGEDERKVFVSVDLLVEADSVEDAESLEPPADLLDKVATAFLPDDVDAAREAHWEITDVDTADAS